MQYQGVLQKMLTEFTVPIQYYLDMNSDFLHINSLLNKEITLSFIKYQCLNCKKDKEIFRQGFCKSCFFETPSAGDWIMRPELSKAHLNIEDRNLEYEKKVQLQPHIVYLAVSSGLKVGVTRKGQIPTRWIDQGATKALVFIEVPNRYLAGITEIVLKKHISDKTNWRKMLQENNTENIDLRLEKEKLVTYLPEEVLPYFDKNTTEITELSFPILRFPTKVKSLNLVKTSSYTGVLKGIKGQYLIFEDDTVFNIRSNEGLVIKFSF